MCEVVGAGLADTAHPGPGLPFGHFRFGDPLTA
jgi:hypothetical protein